MMYLRLLPVAVVIAAVLLTSAGRADVWALLAYPALVWLAMGTVNTQLSRLQPELLAERMKPPSDRDRKSRLASVPLLVAHYAVAGLDVRFGWSALPVAVQVAGFAVVAGGFALVGWTLVANPYASSAVRIQSERGHEVIARGPYRLVRHPMYLGVFVVALGSPLALGSAWAAIPLVPLLAVFVRRTLVEDAMLHAELPGYVEYAAKVRFRLLPAVF
jgi:protein-S-isoprenylcysteine O-methyltransferase Ste14